MKLRKIIHHMATQSSHQKCDPDPGQWPASNAYTGHHVDPLQHPNRCFGFLPLLFG